jgi:hypothetical protein
MRGAKHQSNFQAANNAAEVAVFPGERRGASARM